MSLANFLFQRGKRGTWQLRVPVPRALHAAGSPKERVMSLGTTDRRIASDRALPALHEWKQGWAAMLGETVAPVAATPPIWQVPSPTELESLAVEYGHDAAIAQADERRREPGGWRRHINRTQAALDSFTPLAATSDHSLVTGIAEELVEGLALDLKPGSNHH